MTNAERELLIKEADELDLKFKTSAFINPKDMRRRNEITSLLFTNGQQSDLTFKFGKPRKSNRVTSFTRDRR